MKDNQSDVGWSEHIDISLANSILHFLCRVLFSVSRIDSK